MRRDETRRGEGRGGAHLIPYGADGRQVPVPVGSGVELARDGERRGVAGGLPHPVPVRRRLLSRRRLLHLYSFSGADDGRTDGLVPTTPQISRRGAGRERDGNRPLDASSALQFSPLSRGSLLSLSLLCLRVSPLRPVWPVDAGPRAPDASGAFPAVLHYTLTEPSSSKQRGLAYHCRVHRPRLAHTPDTEHAGVLRSRGKRTSRFKNVFSLS